MRNRVKLIRVGALVLLLMAASTGCQTASKLGRPAAGFQNFGEVKLADNNPAAVVYRGEAPKNDADIAYLASVGVRTIIDLRDGSWPDGSPQAEEALVNRVNKTLPQDKQIAWKNLPCDGSDPDAVLAEFREFLRLIKLPPDQGGLVGPFFFHCQFGRDRTGLFVAFYRIAQDIRPLAPAEQQQLSLDAANEMRDYGQNAWYIPSLYPFVKQTTKAGILASGGGLR